MKIVFLGDSVTDAGRDRSDITSLGDGYVLYATQLIKEKYPEVDFEFVNLGLSGYRTENTLKDWQLISEKGLKGADIVSIMLGINDTWHYLTQGKAELNDEFEAGYRAIIDKVLFETNHAPLMILEHFLLPNKDKDYWRRDVDSKIQVVRRIASSVAQKYVPVDGLIAAQFTDKEPAYFAADGVHPTTEGAQFIASLYLDGISPLIDKLLCR